MVVSADIAVEKKTVVSCPVGWVYFRRSCGTWQGAPSGCRDLLCPDCQRRWAAEARERWFPLIESMASPRMLTLTVSSGFDLAERAQFERASFRRFLDLRLGPRTFPVYVGDAIDFAWSHFQEHEPDSGRRSKRFGAQVKLLASVGRFLTDYHEQHGRWPRVRDLLRCGISSPEVTCGDVYGWHVHRHLVYDGERAPWALWSVLWSVATKGDANIVHVTYKKPDYDTALELIKYVLKPAELTPEQAQEFREVFRHVKKVWTIGDAQPGEPEDKPCPFCGETDCLVEPWTVEIPWSWELSQDRKQVTLRLSSGAVVLRKIDGVWREWWSLNSSALNLKHGQLTCHSRARDGPEVASSGFDETLLDALYGE